MIARQTYSARLVWVMLLRKGRCRWAHHVAESHLERFAVG